MVFEINTKRIGWDFSPNEDDVIDILQKWTKGERFPELSEVQFLDHEPFQLTGVSVLKSLKSWFFLVRRYMNTEINNTVKGKQGCWRLFDETQARNLNFDRFWNHNVTSAIKRHYCFYRTNGSPTSWVAYEYHLSSEEIPENQSHPNDSNKEHAIVCLFMNGRTYDMRFFHFEGYDIVNLLVKRNQGQEEFPQFGLVRFFSKEPYDLPAFKGDEKRLYMLRMNDISTFDRWDTPKGKWKIADNNTPMTCTPVLDEARTRIIGGKRLRKYYDHHCKPTAWNMYEYYTSDDPYDDTMVRDAFFGVVLFKNP